MAGLVGYASSDEEEEEIEQQPEVKVCSLLGRVYMFGC